MGVSPSCRPSTLPPELREPLERASGRLGFIGRRVLWYRDVGSTNDVAMSLAEAGEPEGCVVLADAQSSGRGRLGRTWASPPAAGIYASILLRPPREIAGLITLAAGVAVAEGIEAATGLRTQLKWPNDVCVDPGRKLAGILAESISPSALVLGFGVNVMPAAYPAEVASRATSIESELGRPVDRGLVLADCLVSVFSRYRDLCESRRDEVIAAWRTRASATFGRRVEWDAGGIVRRGVAHDVDKDGALLVQVGGDVVRVISGEVTWK